MGVSKYDLKNCVSWVRYTKYAFNGVMVPDAELDVRFFPKTGPLIDAGWLGQSFVTDKVVLGLPDKPLSRHPGHSPDRFVPVVATPTGINTRPDS